MVRSNCADTILLSAVLPEARRIGPHDVALASCCSDASQVKPGDIYIALVHASGDGHYHAPRAVARGAVAVVAERLLPVSVPQYLVEDTRRAYGRLCQHVVGEPSRRMCTIGVTGTHGKTTIATLIAAILEAAGETVGWSTTFGWSGGAEPTRCNGDVSAPPELARRLAQMSANGCSTAVLEIHSRALAEHQLAGIDLDVAVLSNVRRAAMDWHGTLANYRHSKLRIVDLLKSPGLAVINTDDPYLQQIAESLKAPVIATGLADGSQITATILERVPSEQTFLLTIGTDSVPVRTRIIGDHYVRHCLQAAATCLSLGIDLPTVVHGLESVDRLPGRMERIECGQPFSVFVDAAQSPDRFATALNTLRKVTRGRVISVYGPHGQSPRDERPMWGRVAERGADVGILTSNSPGQERPADIAHDVMDGYQRVVRAHFIPDRLKAIHWALSQARSGDSVLIAGKGDECEQDLGDRILTFDDREVARGWLYDDHQSAPTASNDEPVILRMF